MKNLTKTILATLATAVISCTMFSQQAQATPITGTIGFIGTASASGDSSFNSPTTVTFGSFTVVAATGDYVGASGASATFSNFSFTGDGLTAALVSPPVTPLWTITFGGFSFDLLSLTLAHTDASTLSLAGTGVAHGTGFMNTAATFTATGNSLNGNFNYTITFGTTVANGQAIPDGGSAVALLGVALAGVEILRRKLRTA